MDAAQQAPTKHQLHHHPMVDCIYSNKRFDLNLLRHKQMLRLPQTVLVSERPKLCVYLFLQLF
ncbi:hypothetical protein PLUTE_a5339 [Pseudoalteromonas luteoviolacea DSM 6061]|nr:hypothetical protein [Pseudoalteromonas luteoviolacea DSM 6061]